MFLCSTLLSHLRYLLLTFAFSFCFINSSKQNFRKIRRCCCFRSFGVMYGLRVFLIVIDIAFTSKFDISPTFGILEYFLNPLRMNILFNNMQSIPRELSKLSMNSTYPKVKMNRTQKTQAKSVLVANLSRYNSLHPS